MTEFFKRTETHFRFTWEALVSNRLAIHLLSSGSAMYDMVLRQYLNYYQNYDVTLDHFLTGLDTLGTGRLTFQVLDPDELDRFLSAIRRQLRRERSPFQLAFNHTYQFYAEPMVMFTNTHDQLLVNVPILLRLATQKPLNLYSIVTVPMPFDTEMLDGRNNEYTFINNSYPYMALNEHNYIPLTETQLRMCDKMGPTYYCQNSYVLRQRTQHTCESAIYYKMDAKTITKHCQAKFTANVEFPPKVLDAGETMVLFNLPRPWILLCIQEKQPTEIDFATYKVVDRKEFCECSLTARSFQLDETLVKCTPEINSEADGRFKSYFAINKIIFDYLQAEKDVQLDSTVVQALSRLLDVKPEYDWTPLNWYVNSDLPDNVINKQPSSVIADLMGVMEHIITEEEEEAYQSEIQYRNAQSEFKRFLKSAEGWRKFEFVSSILGMLALVALVIIAIFRSRIVREHYSRLSSNGRVQIRKSIRPTSMCQSIFFTTCLPKPNSISTGYFATRLGRQRCGRKTKARHPNDRVDHNDLNHNNTSGNSLHDIQKMSIRILLAQGMLLLVSIQHDTLRHRAQGYFRRSCKLAFGGSHVGAFRIRCSTPIAIKDHRLSPCLRHVHYKTLLLQTAADRLAEYCSVRFGL